MHKKLIMACMAVVALALFADATAASASPVLTENGSKVAPGSSVTWRNTGVNIFTGTVNISCGNVDWLGTVIENSGTKIKGEVPAGALITGTATGGDCTSSLGAMKWMFNSKLCWETTSSDNFNFTGCGANVVFTQEITGTGPCKYSATSISGTFNTNVTPALLTISEQEYKKSEGGIFCPSSGKIDMALDFYAAGGTAGLTIS